MCSRKHCRFCCRIGAFPANGAGRGKSWHLGAGPSATASDPPPPAHSRSAHGWSRGAHRPDRPFGSAPWRKEPVWGRNVRRRHRWNNVCRHNPPRWRAPSNLQLSALICPIVLDHGVFPLSARSALPFIMPQKGASRNSPLGGCALRPAIKRRDVRAGGMGAFMAN